MLGNVGAVIVYGALLVISLLFLTNFRLGEWLRSRITGEYIPAPDAPAEEVALERKARDLEKKRRALEQEVERSGVGLGQDLQPVPEPTVRDLSVPQAKGSKGKGKNPFEGGRGPVGAPANAPLLEGEVITAREIAAATKDEVLGKSGGAAVAEAGYALA